MFMWYLNHELDARNTRCFTSTSSHYNFKHSNVILANKKLAYVCPKLKVS